jgi:RHS repeat-associated protein
MTGTGILLTDNLSNSYTWDPNWGNPASVNGTALIYDGLGQMVEQQNGSTYTQMLYSQIGKTAIMNGQTLTKAFVALPGGATAIYNTAGLAYYRHSDWLGSSRLSSTAARTVYSASAYAPFGEQYAPFGSSDASFTGQNADTTSTLYDFTFREHSPSQGRWISPDPLGVAAVDPTNPQSWNRYGYVLNSPLVFVDPLGLVSPCPPGSGPNILNPDGTTSCGDPVDPGAGGISFDGYGDRPRFGPLLDQSGGGPGGPRAKSPARQQCEQQKRQQYNQNVTNAQNAFVLGFKVGVLSSIIANGIAGCVVGAAIGGTGGAVATWFLGGEGALLTTPAGCGAGGLAAIEGGIPISIVSGLGTGGLVYYHDIQAAKQQLKQDLQECEKL